MEEDATTTTGANAGGHEAETMTAPAWGFSGSHTSSPLGKDQETTMQVELCGLVGRVSLGAQQS